MSEHDPVIDRVRRALGRTAAAPPPPPPLSEPIVRLVPRDIGLAELFARRAAEMGAQVELVHPCELALSLSTFLRDNGVRRVAMPASALLDRFELRQAIEQTEGVERVARWDQIKLDEMYDFECAVTDATWAVAETGSVVIRTNAAHGRALSLVPMYHVVVLDPKNLLPDLLDLFGKLAAETDRGYTVIISGPSKTADIEMNVVTGVHGPNVVKLFVLR
jgi:L-lactate dehydrogenase complex protein LldG